MQVLVVVVLYKMSLDASQTIQGLCRAFSESPELVSLYKVLVWDNSPEAIPDPQLPFIFRYHHARMNLGTSGAYNGATEVAEDQGYAWMLLLDQDTTVTTQFLAAMLELAGRLLDRDEVAAIAPTVRVGNSIVSPRQQLFNRNRAYTEGECGVAPGEAFAINSGCLIRTAELSAIGGFSLDFWLDYSDMYVFHQLFLRGKKLWRAANVELQHDMSIMDYDRLMTPGRYKNFSEAESAFNDLYKGALENAAQNLRLCVRSLKQRLKYKNPEFPRIAWKQLLYRLRVPRGERIARWRMQGEQRRVQGTEFSVTPAAVTEKAR